MSTAAEDRSTTLAAHREEMEAARAAIFDSPSVSDEFGDVQYTFEALVALAEVSLALWDLAVIPEIPDTEVGDDELSYRKVRQIAPMKARVAKAVFAHEDRLETLRSTMMEEVCDLEAAVQGLARAVAGYGNDVDFPVLAALKELDLNTDTEEVAS